MLNNINVFLHDVLLEMNPSISLSFQRGTLANELERRAKNCDYMNPIDILSIFLQICEGVKAFHETKPEPLAHRDLKTANIVLTDDETPVIMDLGRLYFIISC